MCRMAKAASVSSECLHRLSVTTIPPGALISRPPIPCSCSRSDGEEKENNIFYLLSTSVQIHSYKTIWRSRCFSWLEYFLSCIAAVIPMFIALSIISASHFYKIVRSNFSRITKTARGKKAPNQNIIHSNRKQELVCLPSKVSTRTSWAQHSSGHHMKPAVSQLKSYVHC